MVNISELFGSMVFNDKVMKERLPKDIYRVLKNTMKKGRHLELDIANVVANAMKEWAIEKGCTHYTHWFQPMTGLTAEKHDSFISPDDKGNAIMEFSGNELVKGEPDASSFPSGGIRATFEARGYTAWDPTSYAFIKDRTLCIPTAFCSYNGEALDKKTPLLRSMEAIDKQALRILRLFGNQEVNRVFPTVGTEQEYFLIDKSLYLQRPDLIFTGRTLFGAKPPKGQEMNDHYFGQIKPRVSEFMKEVDKQLWMLGISAKTEHNEVAPSQHELALVYTTANLATDHNQITMEVMKRVADRHEMACLLHEKPFEGVNGSGKHNNWSLSTDKKVNLFEPGKTPYENAQFLVFLMAVIKAVDEHQDLLRISAASAGNDHRLGVNEAPPAVISMFLGDELQGILHAIENDSIYKNSVEVQMEIGATVLPHFPKDTTDRNRTSPFAFTGNKFEFRMLGSASSIAETNIIINTIVADSLKRFAEELELADNFIECVKKLIKDNIKEHKRIIFNGDGYSQGWQDEAAKRNLLNLKTTPEAIPYFSSKENVELFTNHCVFTEKELLSRTEIMLEGYCKTLHIEALTMIDMIKKFVVPSVIDYENKLVALINSKRDLNFNNELEYSFELKISDLAMKLLENLNELEAFVLTVENISDVQQQADFYRDKVIVSMQNTRLTVDSLESLVSKDCWKLPVYSDLLYSVL